MEFRQPSGFEKAKAMDGKITKYCGVRAFLQVSCALCQDFALGYNQTDLDRFSLKFLSNFHD